MTPTRRVRTKLMPKPNVSFVAIFWFLNQFMMCS